MSIKHHIVESNGLRVHVAEQGDGPLVLLVHGFPESWYSWRYQLPALAAAGFRAAAIDVRGYGRSGKPAAIADYRMLMMVADVVGLVPALGETQATLIGHDWGAPIVWHSALLRPDVFRGVAGLSVPYSPPGSPVKPTEGFRMMGGEEEFYIEYFQQPGRAEAELEQDVRQWLLGFYFSASGDVPSTGGNGSIASVAPGTKMRDRFQYPETMPSWLSEADLDYYAGEFERTGFTGGLNRYRNVDQDWSDLKPWAGRPIEIPALFVGGEKDGPTMWGGPAIAKFNETLPQLTRSVILPGAGHWVQQEAAAAVNEHLTEFLQAIH